MAGGSIFAGIFNEPYDIKDSHSRLGVIISVAPAFLILLLIGNTFKALIILQMMLTIQLSLTICMQVYLTSSPRVMGKYANPLGTKIMLRTIIAVVSGLNVLLFASFFK